MALEDKVKTLQEQVSELRAAVEHAPAPGCAAGIFARLRGFCSRVPAKEGTDEEEEEVGATSNAGDFVLS